MPTITFIANDGTARSVDAENDKSIMQSAIENFVPGIIGECGGMCSCGTCHGYIDPAWATRMPPKDENEESILSGAMHTQANSRLTCQIRVTKALDGLIVRLPASQF